MTKDEFVEAGRKLLGTGWQSKLSRLLSMRTARTIRRYAKGERAIPEPIAILLRTWLSQLKEDVE